eukprot:scaffold65535_cov45-Phaeocystis_antarctica.AAC.2
MLGRALSAAAAAAVAAAASDTDAADAADAAAMDYPSAAPLPVAFFGQARIWLSLELGLAVFALARGVPVTSHMGGAALGGLLFFGQLLLLDADLTPPDATALLLACVVLPALAVLLAYRLLRVRAAILFSVGSAWLGSQMIALGAVRLQCGVDAGSAWWTALQLSAGGAGTWAPGHMPTQPGHLQPQPAAQCSTSFLAAACGGSFGAMLLGVAYQLWRHRRRGTQP